MASYSSKPESIEDPAWFQDVLAWKWSQISTVCILLCFMLCVVEQSVFLLAMLKGCGSLADGQTHSMLVNHLGIRHDRAMFLSGRLLAVLTEDYDLRLINMDREK